MKRALHWLGPLACLALAGLYAYAWFNRDPLAVAFDRIEEGMSLQEAIDAVGRQPDMSYAVVNGYIITGERVALWGFEGDVRLGLVTENDVVSKKMLDLNSKTFFDMPIAWIRNWLNLPAPP